jgi:hypothetical protein
MNRFMVDPPERLKYFLHEGDELRRREQSAPWPGRPAQRECAGPAWMKIIAPVRRPDLLFRKETRYGLPFF